MSKTLTSLTLKNTWLKTSPTTKVYVSHELVRISERKSEAIESNIANSWISRRTLDPTHYREVCWDLEQRGGVGETVMHLCLLSATSIHADLAKRLLKFYPKLIVDIYLDEEYYGSYNRRWISKRSQLLFVFLVNKQGENVLHIAIVNEDPAMVKYLLDHGVNYQDRCCGNFMSPEDQKASRYDSLTSEVVLNDSVTNYDGYKETLIQIVNNVQLTMTIKNSNDLVTFTGANIRWLSPLVSDKRNAIDWCWPKAPILTVKTPTATLYFTCSWYTTKR